jgi:histidine triad (HIT) family protein
MKTCDNIEMPDDGVCAFCQYLNGERDYTIVARNDLIAILVTREQRGNPHLLVIPIQHRPNILHVTDEELGALAIGVKRVAIAIDKLYGSEGISVWQNNGVSANQTISHFHFHVAGTLDGGGTEWGEVPEIAVADTNGIAYKIRPLIVID